MSQSRMAVITFLDGPVDPGYGQNPGYGGGRPDNSLPGGPNYPSQGLPGYGRPDNTLPGMGGNYPSHGLPGGGHISLLPVFPFDPTKPDNSLPGQGTSPDNTLPGQQPGAGNELPRPGKKYVVKWLACHGLILVPDNSLPETAEPK
jgi:hypothetical protein